MHPGDPRVTAAVVLGLTMPPTGLSRHGFCARLVALDGTVVGVGGWPADEARSGCPADRAEATP